MWESLNKWVVICRTTLSILPIPEPEPKIFSESRKKNREFLHYEYLNINLEGIPLIRDISRADHLSYSLHLMNWLSQKNMDTLEASINISAKPTKNHHQLTFPKRWIIFDGVQTTPSFSCHRSATWAEHAAWMGHFPFAIHQEKRPQYLLLTKKNNGFHPSILSTSPVGPVHHAWHWGSAQSSPEKNRSGARCDFLTFNLLESPSKKKTARKLNLKSPTNAPNSWQFTAP